MAEPLQILAGRRLFLRIFLWFWIATIILLTAYALTSITLRPAWGFAGRDLLPYLGAQAADEYEARSALGLAAYLSRLASSTHLKAYLLTSSGNSVSGEPVPETASVLARKLSSDQAIGSRRSLDGVFLGVTAKSSSGTTYSFVTVVPRGWIGRAISAWSGTWITLASTFLVSALIWYLLARRLAMPATVLRSATRQFAAGNLTARVTDLRLLKQRDEFADLAHEFNRMASQIESLIGNQKRLIGDISHELGSPLARLRLAVGLARKQLGSLAEAPLDRIERESERLDELSQQLLNLMRFESPQRDLARVRVQLDEFVSDLVKDSDFEASASGRRVLIGATEKCSAEIYPGLLRSALENVIRNAIKYTAEKTAVHIEILRPRFESSVHILVRDHGPGVREDCLPYLFEPFYRVESARDRRSGGVGLGLSIARRAIEMHGGTIVARNWPQGGLEVEIGLLLAA